MYPLVAAPIAQPRFMAPSLGRPSPRLAQGPVQDSQQLRRDGAIIEVEIAIPRALANAQQQAGQDIGTPQLIRALIDTGASISAVQDSVAQAAGLSQSGNITLGGIGGSSDRPLYATRIVLPAYGVEIQPIEIASVDLNFGPFEMLIGRDVLEQTHFLYHGPDGNFTLDQGEVAPDGGLTLGPDAGGDALSTESMVAIGAGGAGLIFAGLFLSGIL